MRTKTMTWPIDPEEGIMGDMEIPEAQIPGQLVFGMPEDISSNKLYQIFYTAMKQAILDTKKEADHESD